MESGRDLTGGSERPQKKLRSACDICHQTKVRCSSDTPCRTCENLDIECVYSVSNRVGRPRGIKNKKTLNRLSKADESRSQIGANTGSIGEDGMLESNGALHDVFNPGSIHPEFSELQTQMGFNQPTGRPLSAPPSVNLTPDIDALNLSLPASDDPSLSMVDSTALWQTFRELADFSTTEDTVMTYDYTTRSPSPIIDPGPLELGAFAQPASFGSRFPQMTPLTSSTVRSDNSGGLRPELRNFDTATTSRPGLMQDPTTQFRSAGARGSMMPPLTGSARHTKTAKVPTCNCLERHAGLLLRAKDLEAQQHPRIDVLLVFAKTGIEAWQSLLDCSICQENEDEEGILLTAMSIRVFVRTLRKLTQNNEHYGSTNTLARDDTRDTSSRGRNRNQTSGSSLSNETAHDKRNSTNPHGWAATGSQDTRDHHSSTSASGARTKLGMFEITGSDRTAVGKVMLSRTLQQIQIVLVGLKKRTGSEQRSQRYRRPMDFEQVHRLRMMGDESEAAANYLEDVESEDDEENGTVGFVLRYLKSLETMVFALRRDIHLELNPAFDGGGGTTYS